MGAGRGQPTAQAIDWHRLTGLGTGVANIAGDRQPADGYGREVRPANDHTIESGAAMRNKPTLWILISAAAMGALLLTQDADARMRPRHRDMSDPYRDYTQGGVSLYAAFGGQGYEIHDDDYADFEDYEDRGFFSLGLGIGLDRRTSLFVEGIGSEHDSPVGDLSFGHLHLGIKYAPNTGPDHKWQPYGKASVGASFLMEDDREYDGRHHGDNGFMGPSFGLGLGIERFVSRRAALFGEAGMIWTEFNQAIIDGEDYDLLDDFNTTSGRLQFGLRFRL
ncbi:MAG: hypothetical protein AB1752_02970 [Candidatus Zixiibacteriota bacterium]